MPDLNKAADVLRFCREQRDEMEANWRRNGCFEVNGFSFAAWVFATRKFDTTHIDPKLWVPGERLERPKAQYCALPRIGHLVTQNKRGTDVFAYVLREYARATAAIGAVICAEIWAIELEGYKKDEEARRARAELPEDLGDAPGRVERLYMSLEHSAIGQRCWWADIRRDPTRLEPWLELPNGGDMGFSGLLADIAKFRS